MLVLISLVIILICLWLYFNKIYSKFSEYGVQHFKPIPVLGNIAGLITGKHHIAEDLENVYKSFPGERFVGRYEIVRPIIVLRDLDLIKKVTMKDFEDFIDRRDLVDEKIDPLFGRSVFALHGQEWKDMRSALSPAFTSSKIRAMVPFMVDVNKQMVQYLQNEIKATGGRYIDVDAKDLTSRYANDVIASCAFGMKVNSHRDQENEFYCNGIETTNFGLRKILIYLGYSAFPRLMKYFDFKFVDAATREFFESIILNTIKDRDEKNILRPDLIHLLMEVKKGKLTYEEKASNQDAGFATVEESDIGKRNVVRDVKANYLSKWADTDLVAQAVVFFLAGFETVSSTMSFLIHEMAANPDVQQRLFEEIKENASKNDGKLDYSCIQDMKYLDMVVSGSRFALCELKVMLYQLLLQFEVTPCNRTVMPATLSKKSFTLKKEGGHWVRLILRN